MTLHQSPAFPYKGAKKRRKSARWIYGAKVLAQSKTAGYSNGPIRRRLMPDSALTQHPWLSLNRRQTCYKNLVNQLRKIIPCSFADLFAFTFSLR